MGNIEWNNKWAFLASLIFEMQNFFYKLSVNTFHNVSAEITQQMFHLILIKQSKGFEHDKLLFSLHWKA